MWRDLKIKSLDKAASPFDSLVENVWFGFVVFREKTELSFFPLCIKTGIA